MKKPKIAVIGAGWAGLSAAAHLVEHADVALYEAGRVAGGRARGVSGDAFSFLDNGQHLLIGAYQGVFCWIRRGRIGAGIFSASRCAGICTMVCALRRLGRCLRR